MHHRASGVGGSSGTLRAAGTASGSASPAAASVGLVGLVGGGGREGVRAVSPTSPRMRVADTFFVSLLEDLVEQNIISRARFEALREASPVIIEESISTRELMRLAVAWGITESAAEFWRTHKSRQDLVRRVRDKHMERKAPRPARASSMGASEPSPPKEHVEDGSADNIQRQRRSSLVKLQQLLGSEQQYEGDQFSTHGDYSAGMVYQFRRHSSAVDIPEPGSPAVVRRSRRNSNASMGQGFQPDTPGGGSVGGGGAGRASMMMSSHSLLGVAMANSTRAADRIPGSSAAFMPAEGISSATDDVSDAEVVAVSGHSSFIAVDDGSVHAAGHATSFQVAGDSERQPHRDQPHHHPSPSPPPPPPQRPMPTTPGSATTLLPPPPPAGAPLHPARLHPSHLSAAPAGSATTMTIDEFIANNAGGTPQYWRKGARDGDRVLSKVLRLDHILGDHQDQQPDDGEAGASGVALPPPQSSSSSASGRPTSARYGARGEFHRGGFVVPPAAVPRSPGPSQSPMVRTAGVSGRMWATLPPAEVERSLALETKLDLYYEPLTRSQRRMIQLSPRDAHRLPPPEPPKPLSREGLLLSRERRLRESAHASAATATATATMRGGRGAATGPLQLPSRLPPPPHAPSARDRLRGGTSSARPVTASALPSTRARSRDAHPRGALPAVDTADATEDAGAAAPEHDASMHGLLYHHHAYLPSVEQQQPQRGDRGGGEGRRAAGAGPRRRREREEQEEQEEVVDEDTDLPPAPGTPGTVGITLYRSRRPVGRSYSADADASNRPRTSHGFNPRNPFEGIPMAPVVANPVLPRMAHVLEQSHSPDREGAEEQGGGALPSTTWNVKDFDNEDDASALMQGENKGLPPTGRKKGGRGRKGAKGRHRGGRHSREEEHARRLEASPLFVPQRLNPAVLAHARPGTSSAGKRKGAGKRVRLVVDGEFDSRGRSYTADAAPPSDQDDVIALASRAGRQPHQPHQHLQTTPSSIHHHLHPLLQAGSSTDLPTAAQMSTSTVE